MKKISIFFKLVVALLCFQLIIMCNIFSYAIENGDIIEPLVDVDATTTNTILKPVVSSPIVDINTPIRVSFDNTDVLSYSIETEGLSAIEVTSGSMEYDITATSEFGVLDVYATYEDDIVVKSSVYTYLENNTVYVSDFSQDQAWYDCMKIKFDNNEITLEEFQTAYNQMASRYIDEYLPDGGDSNSGDTIYNVVQGVLEWEDKDGVIAPLINAKVEIFKIVNGESILLNTQYTQFDGSYYFEMDMMDWDYNGEDIFIRWGLDSKTFKLTNNWVIDDAYWCKGSVIHDVPRAKNIRLNYCITYNENANFYRATYIHQAMTMVERFAIDMGMPLPDNSNKTKLNVAYPSWPVPENSAYCLGNDLISIASIGKNNWKDVTTITHEYSHYVQYLMNIYGSTLSEIICNLPIHHDCADHFVDKATKEYAMELTWSEAWAYVLPQIAKKYFTKSFSPEYIYFDNCLSDLWLETPERDVYYDSYDNKKLDLVGAQDNRGEAQELAVEAFLWDMYDGIFGEDFDSINLGYENWWDWTTQAGMYTLEDFTQYINEIRPDLRDGMGKILSHHKISPEIYNVISYSIDDAPTISWVVNGSEAHPNNRFVIYFYDDNDNYLGKTVRLQTDVSHRTTVSYQVPDDVWQSVVESSNVTCSGTVINIVVGGYRYDNTWISDESREYSGPYYSPYYSIEIASSNHNLGDYEANGSSHLRTCVDCGYIEYSEHNLQQHYGFSNILHTSECIDCGSIFFEEHTVSSFIGINENNHSGICIYCDDEIVLDHTYESYNSCYEKCSDCGYKNQIVEHDYTYSYHEKDAEQHYSHCQCGAIIEEAHVSQVVVEGQLKMDVCALCGYNQNHEHYYTYTPCGDGETHRKSCVCGNTQYQQCFGMTMPGQLSRCSMCGQRLNGGLILPLGEEDAVLPSNKEDEIEEETE